MQAQSYRSDLAWRWLCTAISSFFSTPRFFSNTIIHKNRRIAVQTAAIPIQSSQPGRGSPHKSRKPKSKNRPLPKNLLMIN